VIFTPSSLTGAYVIDLEIHEDERGFFARSCCVREFVQYGLRSDFQQCSISFNKHAGTLRGLHYQAAAHAEAKLVRVTHGAIYDVIVDLRPESPTFKRWFALELTAQNRRQLYVPEGFAHGFQTLTENSEVYYQISDPYVPESARGLRWDDPAFGIRWPAGPRVISDRDQQYPDFKG